MNSNCFISFAVNECDDFIRFWQKYMVKTYQRTFTALKTDVSETAITSASALWISDKTILQRFHRLKQLAAHHCGYGNLRANLTTCDSCGKPCVIRHYAVIWVWKKNALCLARDQWNLKKNKKWIAKKSRV